MLPPQERRYLMSISQEFSPRRELVTSDLVVRKGQIPCKRYYKLGHLTLYSRHQQPQRW